MPEPHDSNNTLPKQHILKKKRAFQEVFSSGRRIRGRFGQLIVAPWSKTQVAFVVGRRTGNAATRNRLRRYLREFYRTHKQLIPTNYAVIFQIFPQQDIPGYHQIESEFTELCQQL
ncbi:MAG: ribonuclease P protein component [Candidatus Marinimicrobia bacterium]|nr:ribonuclease P protein component [Candidatus Neomarinimicrobiota bacterium]MCF7829117.1 ribonuclease P protein component [Candidatus Neomarinimicrobiota bacterium]MCF7881484.1 ribonuclease P protein component [Candidatus Neomarinimicrobiota bacterium]